MYNNDNLEKAKESIKKAIDILEKGGEGSKGGKVIGHTSSGKPVYEKRSPNHPIYNDYTWDDHVDASEIHMGHLDKIKPKRTKDYMGYKNDKNGEKRKEYRKMSAHHINRSIQHKKKAGQMWETKREDK